MIYTETRNVIPPIGADVVGTVVEPVVIDGTSVHDVGRHYSSHRTPEIAWNQRSWGSK
jgi:hypothetical protein